jgi:peptide deformylase
VTIRAIRELGDPVLRTPADEVRAFDRELAALVRDLEETVDHPGRAGLAAPQIGVSARVFSYNIDGVIGHLVNPRLVELSEEIQDGDEGCLSVPGIWAPTVRAMHAVVEGFDVHGEPLRLEGEGLMARCLQHEVDHLDGRVFLDRLTGDARKQAFRMLRERTTSLP